MRPGAFVRGENFQTNNTCGWAGVSSTNAVCGLGFSSKSFQSASSLMGKYASLDLFHSSVSVARGQSEQKGNGRGRAGEGGDEFNSSKFITELHVLTNSNRLNSCYLKKHIAN